MSMAGIRRGVALISVVVLLAAVAGVVVTIAAIVSSASRARSEYADRKAAEAVAEDAIESVLVSLAADPMALFSEVHDLERARVCLIGPDAGAVFQPGSAWPESCGTVWGYTAPSGQGTAVVEVSPPAADSPTLKLMAVAQVGDGLAARSVELRLDSFARFAAASVTDLDTSGLVGLTGEVYSAWKTTLPQAGVASWTVFESETGFDPAPSSSPSGDDPSNLFYARTPVTAVTPPIRYLGEVWQSPISDSQMRAVLPYLQQLACSSAPSVAIGQYASRMCLAPGEMVVLADGSLKQIPDGVTAWLLLSTQSGLVDLRYSTAPLAYLDDCGPTCTLVDSSQALTGFPGDPATWQSFGQARYPVNGLIWSPVTVQIGLCGAASLSTSGGSCVDWSGAGPGTVFDRSFTLLAGTSTTPADVLIGGPVSSTAPIGAVAWRTAGIGYWSRPPGGSIRIEAALMGVGAGTAAPSVRQVPQQVGNQISQNQGGRLTVYGSMVGRGVQLDPQIFTEFELSGDPRMWDAPPPFYPSPTSVWRPVDESGPPPLAVCGGDCSGAWTWRGLTPSTTPPPSTSTTTTTAYAPGPPSEPLNLQATAYSEYVYLDWDPPASDGGSQVTDYAIEYSGDGGATWVAYQDGVSTVTNATVTGLDPGASYLMRVAALNAAGQGPWSSPVSVTTWSVYQRTVFALRPTAWWRLGETSGATAFDSSGNGNNGVYYNGPALGAAGLIAGDPDPAVSLDGTNDYVSVMNASALAPSQFTVVVWVRPDLVDTSKARYVGMKGLPGANKTGWQVYQNINGSWLFAWADGTTNYSVGLGAATAGTRYMLAVTHDGAQGTSYRNGVFVGSKAAGFVPDTSDSLFIGAWRTSGNFFDGVVDEFAFFNRVLAPAEICDLYKAGTGDPAAC